MRAWRRAVKRERCGADDDCWIPEGQPYLLLKGEGWTKVRCAKHAGSPVPDTLEDDPQPVRRAPSSFAGTRELAQTARMGPKLITFDHKLRQAGRDDD